MYVTTAADTAYDCCVTCQQTDNCAGTAFISGQCYSVVGDTCTPGQSDGDLFQTGDSPDVGFTVSNGPCGLILDGNSGLWTG